MSEPINQSPQQRPQPKQQQSPQHSQQSSQPSNPVTKMPINLKYLKSESRPVKVSNNIEIYPISYQSKHLIIQTPRLYLPFGVSSSNLVEDQTTDSNQSDSSSSSNNSRAYGLQLSLEGYNSTPAIMEFIKQINLIDSHFKTEWANYRFNTTIRESKDQFYPPFIRTRIPKSTNKSTDKSTDKSTNNIQKKNKIELSVFDLSNTPKSIEYIIPGSWATSLLYLKHIWVNNVTYQVGLTWYILQTKVKTPIPQLPADHCLIDDPWLDETFCAICYSKVIREPAINGVLLVNEEPEPIPPEYEKYLKMLKLGIPILPVIQRCQMDGLDPEYLQQLSQQQKKNHHHQNHQLQNHTSNHIPAPPPPPSNPSKSSSSIESKAHTQKAIPFSIDDLLKSRDKLGTSSSAKIRKIKPLNVRKRDPRVPSLNMILDRLNQLKSIRKPQDYEKI
jgi:hypothetical protein